MDRFSTSFVIAICTGIIGYFSLYIMWIVGDIIKLFIPIKWIGSILSTIGSQCTNPIGFLISIVVALIGYYLAWESYYKRPVNSHSKSRTYRENTQSYSYEDTSNEEVENLKKKNLSTGFYDGKGYFRSPGEGFYDGKGYFRSSDEGFYDGKGYFRSPGEGFYDGKGYFRSPDEGFYDDKGYFR